MATLNLGRIKPVFQGAYNNSTAYVVDDIVTFGDETFICIQASTGNATSNASYWTKLAAKGTDGTDVGTTLTTQGDILYRDGSGLQRLAAGTSGQALITGGSGANPSWGTVAGGKILQVKHGNHTPQVSTTSTSYQDVSSNTNVSITPSSSSSKILVLGHFNECYHNSSASNSSHYLAIYRDSSEIHAMHTTYLQGINGEEMFSQDLIIVDEPNTTSAITYKLKFRSISSSYAAVRINQNGQNGGTTITLLEIGA